MGQWNDDAMESIIAPAVMSVATLVNNALSSAKSARELAKSTTDSDLKAQISDLYDCLLDMKEKVLELDSEKRSLLAKLEERVKVERDQTTRSFYKVGETDPLCPGCYQGKNQVVYLESQRDGSWWCIICRSNQTSERRSPINKS